MPLEYSYRAKPECLSFNPSVLPKIISIAPDLSPWLYSNKMTIKSKSLYHLCSSRGSYHHQTVAPTSSMHDLLPPKKYVMHVFMEVMNTPHPTRLSL